MDGLLELLKENINVNLFLTLTIGSYFVKIYSKKIKIETSYKVLIFCILLSVGFYFMDDCKTECLKTYFFTYLLATSLYELVLKKASEILGIEGIVKELDK